MFLSASVPRWRSWKNAFRSQTEAWTPREEGYELAECPTIEAGVAEQREGSRDFYPSLN